MQYKIIGAGNVKKPDIQSVAVITPSVVGPKLWDAINSVQNQSYKNIVHYIVFDGHIDQDWRWNIDEIPSNIQVCELPVNTGANGFYGHRIYAAFPHLVNEDAIAFLDEDNWYDPTHIESLVETINKKNLDWAHSLRKVYLNDEFLDFDCCEAIGRWPVAWNETQHLVDTSTYMFRREYLINVCQLWHSGWGGDRRFFMLTKEYSNYATTGLHTLCYRLPDMDKAYGGQTDIFKKYNKEVERKYNGFPWLKEQGIA